LGFWGFGCGGVGSLGGNIGAKNMINLIEEPFSCVCWELSRNSSSSACSVGNHEFTLVVLKEIIWSFSIMNLTSGFIPEPLLSFIVSHLMFKECISCWPVSSPVFSIGGEDKVVIGFLVRFFKMKVHASVWLHSSESWLRLNVCYI
jgi:hypothetical protein